MQNSRSRGWIWVRIVALAGQIKIFALLTARRQDRHNTLHPHPQKPPTLQKPGGGLRADCSRPHTWFHFPHGPALNALPRPASPLLCGQSPCKGCKTSYEPAGRPPPRGQRPARWVPRAMAGPGRPAAPLHSCGGSPCVPSCIAGPWQGAEGEQGGPGHSPGDLQWMPRRWARGCVRTAFQQPASRCRWPAMWQQALAPPPPSRAVEPPSPCRSTCATRALTVGGHLQQLRAAGASRAGRGGLQRRGAVGAFACALMHGGRRDPAPSTRPPLPSPPRQVPPRACSPPPTPSCAAWSPRWRAA